MNIFVAPTMRVLWIEDPVETEQDAYYEIRRAFCSRELVIYPQPYMGVKFGPEGNQLWIDGEWTVVGNFPDGWRCYPSDKLYLELNYLEHMNESI